MRKLVIAVGLTAVVASAADAQRQWTSEIGIQGGFARIKPAGTGLSDQADLIALPAFSAGGLIPGGTALFAVVPVSNKAAVEPSVGLSQFTDATGGGGLNLVTLGLRVDYALSPKLYGAFGPTYTFSHSVIGASQVGLQAAAGYRLKLSSALNGRVEAKWTTWGKTDDLPARNVYAVEFGVTAPLSGVARRPAARGATSRTWRPELGLRGGYSQVHLVSEGDAALLTLPGFTGLLSVAGLGAPQGLFAVFPLGQRWALEPSIDVLRAQSNGFTQTGAHISARLNYAVNNHWYAAGGGNLIYVRQTGADAATATGANVAWGYRFPLMGPLGGRVELSYIAIGASSDVATITGNGASNAFSVTFGLTMPLK